MCWVVSAEQGMEMKDKIVKEKRLVAKLLDDAEKQRAKGFSLGKEGTPVF